MSAEAIETKVFDGVDAEERLWDLELDLSDLVEVVLAGEQARAEATENDPVNAAAWDAYRFRVRSFRERHIPRGWIVDHAGGLERTWSANRKHVVITRAGDEGVGIRGTCPQPKTKPGTEVMGIVNGSTLLLDPDWMNVGLEEGDDFATWMLLVFRAGDVVRSELSSPTGLTRDGVLGWFERILLPEIVLPDPTETTELAEVAEEIDVPVIRRQR